MYEYIVESSSYLKKKIHALFNNSRLCLLKFDEINLPQVRKESDRLYNGLRKQSEVYFTSLIHDLASRLNFNENEYSLKHFLTSFSPVLLYSFDTETERKRARHFEAIASIGDLGDHRVLEEQKKEIRQWVMQVEEFAVDIEREVFLNEAKNSGIKYVQWITSEDDKVCSECSELNGCVFKIENVPRRPHIGCRCWLKRIGGDSNEK